jgi:hypothetical protein
LAFSFENLCEALDMDAGNVRRRLGLDWALESAVREHGS